MTVTQRRTPTPQSAPVPLNTTLPSIIHHTSTDSCNFPFTGEHCESQLCASKSVLKQCSGHGRCAETALGDHACQCAIGWEGSDCGTKKKCPVGPVQGVAKGQECSGLDHGRCDDKTATCLCKSPWIGSACEHRQCPRTKRGVCNGKGQCDAATGICKCNRKWKGEHCETKIVSTTAKPTATVSVKVRI